MKTIDILKLISDLNRLRILNILYHKEDTCVCVLEEILQLNQSNLSRHLNKLKKSGIIVGKKRAQWVDYSLSLKFLKENNYVMEILKNELKDEIFIEDLKKVKISQC